MGTLSVDYIKTAGGSAVAVPSTAGTFDRLERAGNVLQVVSTTKTDTFTTTSTSYVDVTGLSVSITPTSSTSKIFVSVMTNVGNNSSAYNGMIQLLRGSTPIAIGDSAGSRAQASAQGRLPDSNGAVNFGVQHLDSPSTTSATTYKIQIKTQGGTAAVNRTNADTDSSVIARTVSTITVMEIAG
jgi:hypothetical protein